MKRAFLNLRLTNRDRCELFERGLRLHGFKVEYGAPMNPGPQDTLLTWNRIGVGASSARAFEAAGLPVIVVENAAWGNEFAGDRWYSIARNRHNTAGCFPVGGPERWDALGVELAPWRTQGETVILAQRGIGVKPTAMPLGWAQTAQTRHGGRIRPHPGKKPAKALRDDLAKAGKVVTWGSGAAIQALQWGIPVHSDMPDWIGQQDNTDAGRLAMFRCLAWAQFCHKEISSGYAFERILA